MVYVTHDQTEALTFADKVVVMYEGQIVQIGTPAELFEKPKHTFVGYFIGSPGMNVFPVSVEGSKAHVGGMAIELGRNKMMQNGILSGLVERSMFWRDKKTGVSEADYYRDLEKLLLEIGALYEGKAAGGKDGFQ